ncbi:MAG: ribosome biogenesis GTPase Der [Pseudomonadota bacterium]
MAQHILPQVAIVGRPNVGKSTLFNRLTGRRTALVSDMPGLTRDRRTGTALIAEREVLMVDTAGLEDAPRGTIPDRMRAQSEAAIEDADLILFVMDARAGLTPADELFADIVRRADRPTLLVVNKCEGNKGREGFYESYSLGLGEPFAVSAEHGEGLADLDDAIGAALAEIAPLPDASDEDGDAAGEDEDYAKHGTPERPIRLAIVGRPNAGKSTLVNALLGEERMIVGPEPGLTRDSISSAFKWEGRDGPVSFELFDTAGLRRKSRINETAEKLSASDAIRAVRFAEIVVLLVSAENPLEHQDLTIADHVAGEGRALIVAVNKWDLVTDKQARIAEIRKAIEMRMSNVAGIAVVPISALAERGLEKLLAAAMATYATWNKRVSTPDLNRWLAEAVARHAPPAVSGRRVRIRYITQPTARPPTFVAFTSQPQALSGSYQRYLINSLREAFDLPGVPVRLNLRKGDNPYATKGRK